MDEDDDEEDDEEDDHGCDQQDLPRCRKAGGCITFRQSAESSHRHDEEEANYPEKERERPIDVLKLWLLSLEVPVFIYGEKEREDAPKKSPGCFSHLTSYSNEQEKKYTVNHE